MKWIQGPLLFFFILLIVALIVNAPAILLVLLLRNRMDRRYANVLLASGFAAATAYFIWRIEWFDVFRHGMPPVGYFLGAFFPYMTVLGAVGWFLGTLITPRTRV